MKCRACNGSIDVRNREIWMAVGAIEMGIRADLCDSCAVTAPDRIRKELSSPLIRSLVAVVGAKFGFARVDGTAAAGTPRGDLTS